MNEYLKCPTCGKDVTKEDSYCFNCGAKLNQSELKQAIPKKASFRRKRDLAIGFAIIFGGFGIHNYYLAQYKRFAIELAITIITFGSFFLIVYLYALYEAFFIIRNPNYLDGNGNPLT
jgi:TM2 domain-containing membrane protein YozV